MKDAPAPRLSVPPRRSPAVAAFPLLLPVLILFAMGCGLLGIPTPAGESCMPGDNMTAPRLVAGLEEMDAGLQIRITWDAGTEQGAQLPAAYFQAVALNEPSEIVRSVALTAEREITVEFNDLTSYLQAQNTLELILVFPDRREFIPCAHPGMDDIYFLKISLRFASDGSIGDAQFEQGAWLGPI